MDLNNLDLCAIAKRVRAGVRQLDKKIPTWRRTLRRHGQDFDFRNSDCCVLGTLGSHTKEAQRRRAATDSAFEAALAELTGRTDMDTARRYGFEQSSIGAGEYDALDALWRAEFEA